MTEALVEMKNISHSFGRTSVLHDVSLAINPGSYTVLLGPSGSGKTTLLSILGGFLIPRKGSVLIRGVNCTMMAPAIFAAFFLSMTFSWDEFVISFLLTRFDTTLPVEIWNLLRSGLNPKTNAVGSLVFAVSIVLVVLFELTLLRRRKA